MHQLRGPLQEYQLLIKNSILIPNKFQFNAVQNLQKLHEKLLSYNPQPALPNHNHHNKDMIVSPDFKWMEEEQSFISKIRNFSFGNMRKPLIGPPGLYLHGGVGTGKSMLMDLFFNTFPSNRKKRVHFHEFMQNIHQRVHDLKHQHGLRFDPIPTIAYNIAKENWLLCFDEFQVTDIADAMLLRRLFLELFNNGVVLVSTSNRHPDELYKNGIQRGNFLPAIAMIKERCEIFPLESGTDFRKLEQEQLPVFYRPVNDKTDRIMDHMFNSLAEGSSQPKVLEIWGRTITIPDTCNRVGRDTFHHLCGTNRSAADYLLIASEFDILFIDAIPLLNLDSKDEARRFITLIDALYERKVTLICSMDTTIDNIFRGDKIAVDIASSDRLLIDDLKMSTKDLQTSIFSGVEEIFAFKRAVSRLAEMQGINWIGNERGSKIIEAFHKFKE